MTITIGTPTTLTCTNNGLEFDYCNAVPGIPSSYRDIVVEMDLTTFFATHATPDAHAFFAFDTSGTNAHSFPINRHGQQLWRFARGLIFFPDGSIKYERWGAQYTVACGMGVMRPAVTALADVRGPGPVFPRMRFGIVLGLDGSVQYNIEGFNPGGTSVTHLAWGQQTAASGNATLPPAAGYTGKFACGFIDGFTDNSGICPQPTVEPTNPISNGQSITVKVVSYTNV